ncbi:unnamed protein product [Lepeophtheirus salmonis]|uniref:(salmon louse) hypothetical protein n=1 Tax=Lepeophtheirus salmonis TaxID=72036 RepID=A0A7R8HC49_LEPSM|nr:unnamed protein product [Lepeophtheirus salmonis]CAF3001140.1 unnamed protein product [Lepeophtheirus salmonis]
MCCITNEMLEKEVEEIWSEIKLPEDEREKQRDRLERGLENGFLSKDLEKLLGKFEERVTSLKTLKTKLIEHRKKVEMLTVEELTKARKENLLAVREVEDLEESSYDGKVKNVDLESQRSRDHSS